MKDKQFKVLVSIVLALLMLIALVSTIRCNKLNSRIQQQRVREQFVGAADYTKKRSDLYKNEGIKYFYTANGSAPSASNPVEFLISNTDLVCNSIPDTPASGRSLCHHINRFSCTDPLATKYGSYDGTCGTAETLLEPSEESCTVRVLDSVYVLRKICLRFKNITAGATLAVTGTNAPLFAALRPIFFSAGNSTLYRANGQHYCSDSSASVPIQKASSDMYDASMNTDLATAISRMPRSRKSLVCYYLDFQKPTNDLMRKEFTDSGDKPSAITVVFTQDKMREGGGVFGITPPSASWVNNAERVLGIVCITHDLKIEAVFGTVKGENKVEIKTSASSIPANTTFGSIISNSMYRTVNKLHPVFSIPNFAKIAASHGFGLTAFEVEKAIELKVQVDIPPGMNIPNMDRFGINFS